jgi:hypothetical protein
MRLVRLPVAALGAGLAVGAALAQAPVLEPAPAGVEAAELARRAASALAGERTYLEAVLSVREGGEAPQREIRFRAWRERRSGRAFLRVIEPPAEAGTGLLLLPPVLWRYEPRTGGIEPLELARLGDPWLGSDFTLADVLGLPAALDAEGPRLLGVAASGAAPHTGPAYVLELRPGRGAAGGERVLAWLEAERATPLRCERYAADDALLASLRFDEVRETGGRAVPHRWTLSRADAPTRESRIELAEIRFDPPFDDAIFTTRQLLQVGGLSAAQPDARLGAPGGDPP